MKKFLIALILLLPIACSENDFDPNEGIHECEYEEHVLAWDEANPEGDSAEDFLAFAEMDVEDAQGSTIDHDGDERISFEIARRGSHAYSMESSGCGSHIEIPLTFSFRTEDSDIFDEVFEVRGRTSGDDLVINHVFELNDISGSYDPEPAGAGTIYRHSFDVEISPDSSGNAMILVHVEEHHGDAVSSSTEQHWTWTW